MSLFQRIRRLIPKTRKGRLRVFVYGTLVLIPALDMLYVQWQRHIPLGRDTTYIDAPLKENGYPDYVAWLNQKRGAGVKPEENAAITIYELDFRGKAESAYYRGLRAAWGVPGDTKPGLFKDMHPFVAEKLPNASEEEQLRRSGELREAVLVPIGNRIVVPGRGPVTPLVAEWLQVNGPALAVLHTALERGKFFVPILRSDGTKPEYMHEITKDMFLGKYVGSSMVFALAARAANRAGTGDPAGAREDIVDIYRYTRLQYQTDSYWLPEFAAWTILTVTDQLPPADARKLLQELPAMRDPDSGDPEIDESRFQALEAVQYEAIHGIRATSELKPYHFDFIDGETIPWTSSYYFVTPGIGTATALLLPVPYARLSRDINHWCDEVEKISHLGNRAAVREARKALHQEVRDTVKSGGFAYQTAVRATPYLYYFDGDFESRNADGLARLALALRVYQADHGSFPEALSALAGSLLPEVPGDFLTGKPWGYLREGNGYVIYSDSPKTPVLRAASPEARLEL